jgi:hypothetical protein
MKLRARQTIAGLIVTTTVAWVLGLALVSGQGAPAQEKAPMSEDVFKNVQVLRGIPVNEFMGTMGVFSASLGMSCEDCHSADDRNWAGFAADNPRKNTARRMVLMMQAINKTNFGGRQVVTCYTCHRGNDRPQVTPSLAALYGPIPPLAEPEVIVPAPGAPSADQVLDKYLQAIGGTQRLAALSSFVARGTSAGYGPEAEPRPVEIYAKAAPAQRTIIIHTGNGDSTTTYDGRVGWLAAPLRPVPVLALSTQDLDGLKLDAELSFPAHIKQALTRWRVGPATLIDDREVRPVQGTSASGGNATLYFDEESGLLVRQVRFVESPVAKLPTQIDYSDYRDVAGVKVPFKWTTTWLGGREAYELSGIQPNVAIDAARFSKPAPPVVPPSR